MLPWTCCGSIGVVTKKSSKQHLKVKTLSIGSLDKNNKLIKNINILILFNKYILFA